MTNPLCTQPECRTAFGCAHRGPQGQMCHFEVEKRLCDFLDLEWSQDTKLDALIELMRTRFVATNAPLDAPPEDLAAQIAARWIPSKSLEKDLD